MTPSPGTRAAIALTVYLIGLIFAFGVRTWQHHLRTGDTGIRGIASDTSTAGRWGVGLFAAALALGAIGPLLAILVPAATPPTSPGVWWTGLGLSLAGLALVLTSQQSMGTSWRIGVDTSERTGLVTTGLFTIVRNPIFTGMALAMAGVTIMAPNPASLAALIALIIAMELQVRNVEEPYLLKMHGQDFLAYAARTGRFIPAIGSEISSSD